MSVSTSISLNKAQVKMPFTKSCTKTDFKICQTIQWSDQKCENCNTKKKIHTVVLKTYTLQAVYGPMTSWNDNEDKMTQSGE